MEFERIRRHYHKCRVIFSLVIVVGSRTLYRSVGGMLVLLETVSFGVDPARNVPVVLMKESGGSRTITIPLGAIELSAIAFETMQVSVGKPLTIDLVRLVLETLGGTLEKVVLFAWEAGNLRARLHIVGAHGLHCIECAVTDAVALSMRCKAPFFTTEEVLEKSRGSEALSPAELLRHSIRNLETLEFGRYYLE